MVFGLAFRCLLHDDNSGWINIYISLPLGCLSSLYSVYSARCALYWFCNLFYYCVLAFLDYALWRSCAPPLQNENNWNVHLPVAAHLHKRHANNSKCFSLLRFISYRHASQKAHPSGATVDLCRTCKSFGITQETSRDTTQNIQALFA